MKVAVVCQSLLLSKALHSFLGELIVPYKQCDFVISDKKIELDKPIFHISTLEGELLIPFSKSTLWRRIQAKTFPHPVKLSERITVWRVEDIRRWIAEQGD